MNVSNDPALQLTKIWVNCLVRDGDMIIGIIGTGIDLTEFIQTAVKANQVGVTNMFVDADGSIQAHSDPKKIDYHTLVNAPEDKKTIYHMIDDEAGRDKLRAMMDRLKTDPNRVETGFLNIQGKRALVGAAAMEEIGWFAVTVLDIEALKLGKQFVPIVLLMAGAMVLILVVIAVLLNRTVLNRIARLELNVRKVRDGNFTIDTDDTGSDEIGRLNANFIEMAGEIRKHTQELEKKVRDRTVDLLSAKEDAEMANHTKSKFLAAMSHDLRTPLNAILGFADILSGQYFGPINEKYQEYAEDIHASGEHLLELVNEILDLSTIEAGKQSLVKEHLSTMEIVRECERIIEDKARSKNIDLITELPEDLSPLYADRRAFKQILLNLLSNAIKFTPQGGRVTVSAKASKRSTTLKVTDTGMGIPAEKLPKLTDPFNRADTDPYLAEQGWGLGLTITKSLIDLHDGTLDIKSTVGKGTTVTMTLPNAEA